VLGARDYAGEGLEIVTPQVVTNLGSEIKDALGPQLESATQKAQSRMREGGRALLATVRSNPIPVALAGVGVTATGVGVTWLLVQSRNSEAGAQRTARGNGAGVAQRSARRKVAHVAGQAGQNVQHLAQDMKTRGRRTLAQHPLAVGAAALAVGTAIGAALPSTVREGRWLGEKRREVMGRARSSARSAVSKVEALATSTGSRRAGTAARR
jgi:hypothetical protein